MQAHAAPEATDAELASRFLMSASFGGTKAQIESFHQAPQGGRSQHEHHLEAATEWVRKQQEDVPPTLHRALFRTQANPPNMIRAETGGYRDACEVNSRWVPYAMTIRDVKARRLHFEGMDLFVDGMPRSIITENATFEDVDLGNGPWIVCSVEERIDGRVSFGMNCRSRLSNPQISFEGNGPNGRVAMVNPTMQAVPAPASDVYVLSQAPSSCSAPGFGPVFARTTSSSSSLPPWLMLEKRLRLVANALESPAQGVQGEHGVCPTVKKSFLNAHTCVPASSGCSKPLYSSAHFVLNETSARPFFEIEGQFVYVVKGLRLDNARDPCSDTTTRWRRVTDDPQCSQASAAGSSEIDETTHAWLTGLL